MNVIKIAVGAVAVTGVAYAGYKAVKHYQRKRAEKQFTDAVNNIFSMVDELDAAARKAAPL